MKLVSLSALTRSNNIYIYIYILQEKTFKNVKKTTDLGLP